MLIKSNKHWWANKASWPPMLWRRTRITQTWRTSRRERVKTGTRHRKVTSVLVSCSIMMERWLKSIQRYRVARRATWPPRVPATHAAPKLTCKCVMAQRRRPKRKHLSSSSLGRSKSVLSTSWKSCIRWVTRSLDSRTKISGQRRVYSVWKVITIIARCEGAGETRAKALL